MASQPEGDVSTSQGRAAPQRQSILKIPREHPRAQPAHQLGMATGAQGRPWWLSSKESACSVGGAGSTPGLGRSPGRGNGNSVFLLAKSHGQRSLAGYSPQGHKESDTAEWVSTQSNEHRGPREFVSTPHVHRYGQMPSI